MLRKKVSIKPNLRPQAKPSPTPNVTATATAPAPAAPAATPSPPAIHEEQTTENLAVDDRRTVESLGSNSLTTQPSDAIDCYQKAISELTSQRLEPIKSIELQNKDVKLRDLLFINPPLTRHQKRNRKQKSQLAKQDAPLESHDDEDSTLNPVPKVKVGPDGRLILDESSTTITRKNLIEEKEAIVEDNEDIISKTNYDSFRRRPTRTSQTKWSPEDTKKFYHAMTIFGTDFSMMESLLFSGTRSRTELHKKFKREERINKKKVDIALSSRISVNSEELDDLKEIFQN